MTNLQAIDLLKGLEQSLDDYCELNDEEKTAFRMAITALEVFGNSEQLPSAEPERKKGEWIPAFNGVFKGGAYWFSCSECGRIVPEVRNGGWNYCPNCGADMRGDKDEDR